MKRCLCLIVLLFASLAIADTAMAQWGIIGDVVDQYGDPRPNTPVFSEVKVYYREPDGSITSTAWHRYSSSTNASGTWYFNFLQLVPGMQNWQVTAEYVVVDIGSHHWPSTSVPYQGHYFGEVMVPYNPNPGGPVLGEGDKSAAVENTTWSNIKSLYR